MKDMDFEERFGMMVDIEYTRRKNNRLNRLIKNAEFEQPDAYILDIDYTSGRKLNKNLIKKLALVIIYLNTETYLLPVQQAVVKLIWLMLFGMEACKQFYKAKYVRLPDLLLDIEYARQEGNYKKVLAKYANPILLIIDEWLLLKPTPSEQKDIFELLHHRRKRSSTILCSQYRHEGWHDQLGGDDSTLADAILDRIVHDAYMINITSIDETKDLSMREVYGLDKNLIE